MEKLYKEIDGLNVVKLLQIAAVAIFLFGFFQLMIVHMPGVFNGAVNPFATFPNFMRTVFSLLAALTQILYSPLVLLALAEIIKLMSKEK